MNTHFFGKQQQREHKKKTNGSTESFMLTTFSKYLYFALHILYRMHCITYICFVFTFYFLFLNIFVIVISFIKLKYEELINYVQNDNILVICMSSNFDDLE